MCTTSEASSAVTVVRRHRSSHSKLRLSHLFPLRHVLLLALFHLTAAMPAPLPHTCTLVELVSTSLPSEEAAAILAIYHEVAEVSGAEPEPIAKALTAARGGFWDVMMIGTAFSYSVTCIEFVELAGAEWNIILCKEATDANAEHCGDAGLRRYANGTLSVANGLSVMPDTPFSLEGEFHLSMYANYMTDSVEAKRAERVPVVTALLESMLAANALHTPHAADEIRRQLWPEEPTMWNVLVEVHAGGHFYFSEEQFNFGTTASSFNAYTPVGRYALRATRSACLCNSPRGGWIESLLRRPERQGRGQIRTAHRGHI